MRFVLISLAVLAVASVGRGQEGVLAGPNMKEFAPDSVKVGWKYFREGDYKSALRRFQIAIQHDGNSAPGYYGIACVYNVEGKFDDAIKFYREALKRDPTF